MKSTKPVDSIITMILLGMILVIGTAVISVLSLVTLPLELIRTVRYPKNPLEE